MAPTVWSAKATEQATTRPPRRRLHPRPGHRRRVRPRRRQRARLVVLPLRRSPVLPRCCSRPSRRVRAPVHGRRRSQTPGSTHRRRRARPPPRCRPVPTQGPSPSPLPTRRRWVNPQTHATADGGAHSAPSSAAPPPTAPCARCCSTTTTHAACPPTAGGRRPSPCRPRSRRPSRRIRTRGR